jgi:hypothetical protein
MPAVFVTTIADASAYEGHLTLFALTITHKKSIACVSPRSAVGHAYLAHG